ncbi:TetR/AcrR family transcriptional regulator [Campylobacter estrildidarum]|uniref:TetR/AcrR family transcriptional regulator n=1 Tax=Campylobacter estrildidarum TaxID=2510189 RepID=A0A4V6DYL8_9BACT|nr:TetR/AcrR family transcriptional regulator [Campylobacter estrildidarum]TKX31302.1 TetR/AcrR family transcriptional regulator [Campylobacter estrildidarum]
MSKTISKKSLTRKNKIKKVACELFLSNGFQETNLSDIIKISGGSYTNIYENFHGKEGLFFEILDDICKEHSKLITSQFQILENKSLREKLISFGLAFVSIYNKNKMVDIGKMVFSLVYEKKNFLKKWLSNNQQYFAYNILIDLFKKQKNNFLEQNASKLAIIFCTMLKEPYYSLNVLANFPLMDEKEQKEHVEFIVDIFLNGLQK